ncbi:MAG: hypothetical protein HY741_08870 [Chloroflexi bacterium]|nr:hypothetical protein [Chloroflexota bacterium]
MTEELACYDVAAEQVTINGVAYSQPMEDTETYMTIAGEVTVKRHLYRPAGRGTRHVCPLELRAGIIEGFFTPAAARQAAYVVAHMPPATGAALFNELGSMRPSPSSLERLPKGLSARWEAHRQDWETQLRSFESVPTSATTLVVSLDGVLAPIRSATAEKAEPTVLDKQPTGPKGYQEVGCGTVSLHDAAGERLQTVRYGRMPERKKITLCQELEAEVQAILAVQPRLKLVKLADGARDNWRFLDQLNLGVPAAQIESWEIVDYYHACDHLKHALALIWGEQTPAAKAEFARLKTILKETDGGVERVIETLRYRVRKAKGHQREQLRKELTYFRNQRHRMNYAAYLRENLPIASGVVEAACKTLVKQRLKQSGMRWKTQGGQAILTLRSLIQSERWERGWALLRGSYQQTVWVGAAEAYFKLPLAA